MRLTQRQALNKEQIEASVPEPPRLSHGGKLTAFGIGAIAIVLISASALNLQLGLPTFICGAITAAAVLALSRQSPWPVLQGISWSVLRSDACRLRPRA